MADIRYTMILAAGAVTAMVALGIGGSAIATAPAMADVTASGGAGTTVDTDGTQGDLKPAVQGTEDSDGDQDAYLRGSDEAVPQYKATHK